MGAGFQLDRRSLLTLGATLASGVLGCVPPASAAGEALQLDEVAPGVHVYRAPYELVAPANQGAIANMTLIVGREAAAVVDTGNSRLAGAHMLAAVREVTDLPIRYVVNTHMHPDHTLGNAAFDGAGARFVAHHKMPRALSVRAETYLDQANRLLGALAEGTRIVLPDLLVQDRMELDLGDRKLLLEAHPTAHTDNDLTVRDAATGTWILGDLLFVGHVPTLDGSLRGWLALLDRLAAEPVPRVVPGHGPASVAWPESSRAERGYLARLADDVRALIARGGSMAEAPEVAALDQRGRWALYDEFNARNAIAAYHELEWE